MYAEDTGSLHESAVHARHLRALSKDDLRSLVCEWTRILKEEGFAPEKALVTVKTLVREAVAPHVAHYGDRAVGDDRTALIIDASQWCIEMYFTDADDQRLRGRAAAGCDTAARKSLSRKLLLKLLALRPGGLGAPLASELSVDVRQLAAFASGTQLMPIAVQERLAELIIDQHPELARVATRLRLQLQAARRYQNGEVVRHSASPPRMW